MAEDNAKKLRVAAVQMESKNGLIKVNLEHALPFVDEAAKKGAKLIVLPEFMPTGYIFTNAIWDAGERNVA
jgi:N-carbamoylputrescine amidase